MGPHITQRLLVDTDAYCKLGVAKLLSDAVMALGFSMTECGRLAALPYMLKRGRLRNILGDDTSDELAHLAETTMPLALQPADEWLDLLTPVPSIDPGEAQLLAASAEHGLLMLTGDKQGLLGVKDIPGYAEALNGQVIVVESILAELCVRLGEDSVRSRIGPLMELDTAVRVCFSSSDTSPLSALLTYYGDLAADLEPLKLWKPPFLGMS